MKLTLRSLLPLLLLFSPLLSYGQGYNLVGVVPDGRTETDTIAPNTTGEYLFSTLAGHSYSIEQSKGLSQPTLPMYVFPGCPSPYGISIIDTTFMDPAVDLNLGFGQQRQRDAFACPGPVSPPMPPGQPVTSGQSLITFNNFNATPYTFSITVTDTTLFSAKWGAGTNFDTFWTFTNTSSAPVNIGINVLDINGSSQFIPGLPFPGSSMNIPPGAMLSVDTTQIPPQFRANPPVPLTGTVRVTEDGPPGAILATETIVTNAGSPAPTVETVKLAPKHR
jgi:hypothetical protein